MKKLFTLVLVVLLVVSLAPAAFAANATPGSTTLTTTVPDAEYTLNIPADTAVTFNADYTTLGNVTVTGASGFAVGKNLKVTVIYDAFKPDLESISTTIPFEFKYSSSETIESNTNSSTLNSGGSLTFKGKSDGTVYEKYTAFSNAGTIFSTTNSVGIYVAKEDWGKALAGDYTATIAFTAEVVAEE